MDWNQELGVIPTDQIQDPSIKPLASTLINQKKIEPKKPNCQDFLVQEGNQWITGKWKAYFSIQKKNPNSDMNSEKATVGEHQKVAKNLLYTTLLKSSNLRQEV